MNDKGVSTASFYVIYSFRVYEYESEIESFYYVNMELFRNVRPYVWMNVEVGVTFKRL